MAKKEQIAKHSKSRYFKSCLWILNQLRPKEYLTDWIPVINRFRLSLKTLSPEQKEEILGNAIEEIEQTCHEIERLKGSNRRKDKNNREEIKQACHEIEKLKDSNRRKNKRIEKLKKSVETFKTLKEEDGEGISSLKIKLAEQEQKIRKLTKTIEDLKLQKEEHKKIDHVFSKEKESCRIEEKVSSSFQDDVEDAVIIGSTIKLQRRTKIYHFLSSSLGTRGFHIFLYSSPDEGIQIYPKIDRMIKENEFHQDHLYSELVSSQRIVFFDYSSKIELADDGGRLVKNYIHVVAIPKDSSLSLEQDSISLVTEIKDEVESIYLSATNQSSILGAITEIHGNFQKTLKDKPPKLPTCLSLFLKGLMDS